MNNTVIEIITRWHNQKTAILLIILALVITSSCSVSSLKEFDRLTQILEAGNDALLAGKYNEAIRLYDSGLEISPEDLSFMTGKSSALRMRGAERYNKSITLKDEKVKVYLRDNAKQDIRDSADLAKRVLELEKSQTLAIVEKTIDGTEHLQRLTNYADALRLLITIVDKTKTNEAIAAFNELINNETDPNEKVKVELVAAKILVQADLDEQAIVLYKKILKDEPDNIEALVGIGLSLSKSGDVNKYREAESYLQRFIELAPDNHPFKQSVKDTLDVMKQDDAKS